MKTSRWFFVLSVVLALVAGMAGLQSYRATIDPALSTAALMPPAVAAVLPPHRPVVFEENLGQFDVSVRYLSRGKGYSLFLTDAEAVMLLASPSLPDSNKPDHSGAVFRLRLLDSDPPRRIEALDEQATRSHYFTGGDPAGWQQGVSNYARVRYEAVYPGIDLVYYGKDGMLEYDFIVAPGADPSRIGLSYAGVESLSVDADGDLLLNTSVGIVKQHAPFVYQQHEGVRQPVASQYRVDDGRVSFQLAAYDPSRPLVIDPALSYASYVGGSLDDEINDIAVDADGAIYVTGRTLSNDFPGAASSTHSGGADVFVSKFSAAGELLFTTYLGGAGPALPEFDSESGNALIVDATGNIYVTGAAVSGFPKLDSSGSSGICVTTTTEVFVVKLGNDGALLYSECFGGGQHDSGQALALDTVGDVYVTGWTGSADFFAADPLNYGGARDAFIFKLGLGSGAGAILFSGYLGGSGDDMGRGITLTASAVTIVGATNSAILAPGGGYRDDIDVFVTHLSRDDGEVLWSCYVGGSGDDSELSGSGDGHLAIASDFTGAVYITGQTRSTNFPLSSNSYQSALNGDSDMFVTKLSASGAIQFSTYLGGSSDDAGHDIAVAAAGDRIVLTGRTTSTDFPAADANSSGFPYQGQGDAVMARLGATLRPDYALYYGGTGDDAGHAIALQADGSVYVGGTTTSTDLAYVDQYPLARQVNTGGQDGFVTRIGADVDLKLDVISATNPGGQLEYTLTVFNNGPGIATHVLVTVLLQDGFSYLSSYAQDAQCVGSDPLVAIADCDLGQLASGSERQVSVTMSTAPGASTPDVVLSANEYDADLTNNVFGGALPPGTEQPPLLVVTDSGSGGAGTSSSGGGGGTLGLMPLAVLLLGLGCHSLHRRCFFRHAVAG